MDQESFRKLLEIPRPGSSNATVTARGSLLAPKKKAGDPSQPSFKPRKVSKKQTELKYRDRAAERRIGEGNDFAQVEAVLEDFERRTAQNEDKTAVDEQRRYLGGDSDHSILVKGLDVALLEQNKARAALSTEDDESLEEAFLEASTELSVPKKKTREDLIRELKEKRQKGAVTAGTADMGLSKTAEEEARLLEEAKKAGKFKPIGFKPINPPANEKGKRKKGTTKAKDDRMKKKQKLDGRDAKKPANGNGGCTDNAKGEMLPPPLPLKAIPPNSLPLSTSTPAEAEPENDNFDIFAGAGEYEGIDLGDDDEDDSETPENRRLPADQEEPTSESSEIKGRWFAMEESESGPSQPSTGPSKPKSPPPEPTHEEDEQPEQPARLVPLASSALPSIKDFLAMDKAASQQNKRRKRKDKKGGGGPGNGEDKVSAEAKADRDYKRLKTYTDKKAAASTSK